MDTSEASSTLTLDHADLHEEKTITDGRDNLAAGVGDLLRYVDVIVMIISVQPHY
jgi:hypothetical protein